VPALSSDDALVAGHEVYQAPPVHRAGADAVLLTPGPGGLRNSLRLLNLAVLG